MWQSNPLFTICSNYCSVIIICLSPLPPCFKGRGLKWRVRSFITFISTLSHGKWYDLQTRKMDGVERSLLDSRDSSAYRLWKNVRVPYSLVLSVERKIPKQRQVVVQKACRQVVVDVNKNSQVGYSLILSTLRISQKHCPYCELVSFPILNIFFLYIDSDINQ